MIFIALLDDVVGHFMSFVFLTCHSPGRCCFLYLMSKTVLLISGSEEET